MKIMGADVLILEDCHNRHEFFRKNLVGNNLVIVETTEEAIRLLSGKMWDFLFLDHDLGGQSQVPSGPGTGYEVACWIEQYPIMKPKVVIIHSHNETGAKRMWHAVKGAYLLPGAWLYDDLAENWDKAAEVLEKKGFKSGVLVL